MLPYTGLPVPLYEDHLVNHDFVDPVADVIHSSDPRHLVTAFQFFGDALLLGKLFYQLKSHFIRLFVDLLKIRVFSMVHCVAKFVCDNDTLNSIRKITVNSYSSDIMRSKMRSKKWSKSAGMFTVF